MKIIDFLVLLPLIWGAYEGYKRGFFLTLFGSVALLLGVIGGFKLMQVGIDFLKQFFPNMPRLLPYASFCIIFLLIVIVIYLIAIAIKKAMDFTIFAGTLDNAMGAVLNMMQWAFITSVILWLTKQAELIPVVYTKDAKVYDFMVYLAPKTVNWFGGILPYAGGLFKSIKGIF
jgi:membrane protein required for colicin V production